MKYTVLWTPTAEQHLAAVWMAARDRNAVTTAASAIEELLTRDPESVNEIRFDTVRTFSIAPLGVDFEIIEADCLIYVLAVWDVAKGEPI